MPGKILIADGSSANRIVLKSKLSGAYYDVSDATSGEQALMLAREDVPDVILLSTDLPDIEGFTVCRLLKADPLTMHIPVILTAAGDAQERVRGLEVGADDFLTRPYHDLALFARVRSLMRIKHELDELTLRDATATELGLDDLLDSDARESSACGSVRIVCGDPESAAGWCDGLKGKLQADLTTSGDVGYSAACPESPTPDVFLISQASPGNIDALRLIAQIKAQPESKHAATVLVVDSGDYETATCGLDLGATDFIETPFDCNELAARLRTQIRRKKASDRLRLNLRDGLKLAVTDPLTGVYNRRYATTHMHKIMLRARQKNQPFAVMMLDLDRFKRINDQYGHDAGDNVLREFASRLQRNIRGVDLVARLGGEEFFVAMPDATAEDASRIAERVRGAVEDQPFNLPDTSLTLRVTVSIGVAVADDTRQSPEILMKEADRALFASKHAGRNCVRFNKTAA
jgi:two-component system, cell cycle response regulator